MKSSAKLLHCCSARLLTKVSLDSDQLFLGRVTQLLAKVCQTLIPSGDCYHTDSCTNERDITNVVKLSWNTLIELGVYVGGRIMSTVVPS